MRARKVATTIALLLLNCLWWFVGSAYGESQKLLPQGKGSITVSNFTLNGLAADADSRLSLDQLKYQLQIERARFGKQMTVDELHQVADALTLYVRGKGFPFHTLFLPPQEISGGVVEFRLQQGVFLGAHVINHTQLADSRFSSPFAEFEGQVLYGPNIDDRVQALKGAGGFSVFAFYSRGNKPGEVRLNLKVEEGRKHQFSFKADNYGSATTGEYRVIGQYSTYQLTGHHDRLSVAVLGAVDGVANTYGSLYYSLPFRGLRWAWDISASNNQFELGDRFEALGLKGDATVVRTGFTRIGRHQQGNRASMRLGGYDKRNNIDGDGEAADQEEVSQAITWSWSKDKQWDTRGSALSLSAELSHGQFEVANLAEESFDKLDLSAFWMTSMGSGNWRNLVQFSSRAQVADVALPSIEGFSLTGAYGVRGFAPGQFSADNAVLASFEWRLPSFPPASGKAMWRIEPYLFGDLSYGDKVGLGDDESIEATFQGAGIGFRGQISRHFSFQIVGARGLYGKIGNNRVTSDDQIWCEIRFR